MAYRIEHKSFCKYFYELNNHCKIHSIYSKALLVNLVAFLVRNTYHIVQECNFVHNFIM